MLPGNRPRPRRPVWKPSRAQQLLALLRPTKPLVKWVAVAALALLILYVGVRRLRDVLIIDPIAVPKRYAEAGLTPEVVADRIRDTLRQIEADVKEDAALHDRIALRNDEAESMPDIAIPGTSNTLRTVVEMTRELFGIYPKHVSGEIIQPLSLSQNGVTRISIVIRVTQGQNQSQPIKLDSLESGDTDLLARSAAEMILRRVNPILLAVYSLSKDSATAVAIAEEVKEDPSSDFHRKAEAHNVLGLALLTQHKYDEAILNYRMAVKHDPQWSTPYSNLGAALVWVGRYEEAIAKSREALALEPKNKYAYNNWAGALVEVKRYDEAIAKLRKAIGIDPKFAQGYSNLCATLNGTGKYDQAIIECKTAVALNPKLAIAYSHWGVALFGQKKYEEAITKFREAVALDPKLSEAYYHWGLALQQSGHDLEALELFAKANPLK
jgi:tetratricopeptide (TPR) repeat protein